jgi:hypothetical protein
MHGRSAGALAGGGLLMVGGFVTGAVAQASPGVHVEVFSDSGAVPDGNAANENFGNGSTKETLSDAISYLDGKGGGTITFASSLSGHTIDLAENLPDITANTTVTGLGAQKLALDGGGSWHTLTALKSADLTVSGLTVEHAAGSAVYAAYGNLTVTDSVLEHSHYGGVYVGQLDRKAPKVTLSGDSIRDNGDAGIYVLNDGTLRLSHSVVENNQWGVGTYGGPSTITDSSIVNNGTGSSTGYGGVRDHPDNGDGPITVVNSTISGNSLVEAGNDYLSGAGIAVGPGVDLTLVGDTVTDNKVDNIGNALGTGARGGGISVGLVGPGSGASTLTVEDSVVAGNKVLAAVGAGGAKYPDIAITAQVKSVVKDSLIGAGATAADTLTALTFSGGNQKGTTAHPLHPRLGKLGPEGSKTATAGGRLWVQEPLKGSPLIGKGAAKPFSTKAHPFKTDELGTKRPSKGVTIGAYQVPPKKKPKKRK